MNSDVPLAFSRQKICRDEPLRHQSECSQSVEVRIRRGRLPNYEFHGFGLIVRDQKVINIFLLSFCKSEERTLRYHGLAAFRKAIQKDLEYARRLGDLISQASELELTAPIELSAVCFRYVGNRNLSEVELNRLNLNVLRRVNERGLVYLSNAELHSKFCLRACIVNHRTTDSDLDAVLSEVLAAAREVRPV